MIKPRRIWLFQKTLHKVSLLKNKDDSTGGWANLQDKQQMVTVFENYFSIQNIIQLQLADDGNYKNVLKIINSTSTDVVPKLKKPI